MNTDTNTDTTTETKTKAKKKTVRVSPADYNHALDLARGETEGAVAAVASFLDSLEIGLRHRVIAAAMKRTKVEAALEILEMALDAVPNEKPEAGNGRGRSPRGEHKIHRHTKNSNRRLVSLPMPDYFVGEIGDSVRIVADESGSDRLVLVLVRS